MHLSCSTAVYVSTEVPPKKDWQSSTQLLISAENMEKLSTIKLATATFTTCLFTDHRGLL